MTDISKAKLNEQLLSKILALIGATVLFIGFFMPYATAIEDNLEFLQEYPDSMYIDEINMTNEEAISISLFEYFNLYKYAIETGEHTEIAIICVTLICAAFAFTLLSFLFIILKKPVVVLIFNLLNALIFYANVWDYSDRGIIENSSYEFGIGYYIYYIAIIIVFVSAVWMLICKIKSQKKIQTENYQTNKMEESK